MPERQIGILMIKKFLLVDVEHLKIEELKRIFLNYILNYQNLEKK